MLNKTIKCTLLACLSADSALSDGVILWHKKGITNSPVHSLLILILMEKISRTIIWMAFEFDRPELKRATF